MSYCWLGSLGGRGGTGGSAAHGWEDQRWALARVQEVIARKFHVTCSIAAEWRLLHRHNWSWQAPARLGGRVDGRLSQPVEMKIQIRPLRTRPV
ncbi:winged helix-turn-helix domain-containing protein [Streptomyces sp. NPDC051976]|uniref:helix-turn-helix domain-containing protein n=1 Tax=Streptomyces sp. NPDC051976 TaxID=3154947 RepID=UPI00341D21E1